METRRCHICEEMLPLTQFYSNGLNRHGKPVLAYRCKECDKKKRMAEQGEASRRNQSKTAEFTAKGCVVCTEKDPVTLCFHHPDPKVKEMNVGAALRRQTGNTLEVELAKGLVVVCFNCHRRIHVHTVYLLDFAPKTH